MGANDRVRENTRLEINRGIDSEIEQRIHQYANRSTADITQRLNELEEEWDIERWLQTNASMVAFTGRVLSATRSRKWLLLPGVALPFLFQHAVQGWCPPLTIFRAMNVRTRSEIDREKYAMMILRGDFDPDRHASKVDAALHAAGPA